jgi:quercetin dioxygenase-like cupin family protein
MYKVEINDTIMCRTGSGNKIYWMLTTEIGVHNYELRYIEIPPGGKSSYGHHPHEHEVFIVRGEGRLKGKFPEEALKPGTAVFIDNDEEHQWVNTSDEDPLGFICVVPKGAESESKPPC